MMNGNELKELFLPLLGESGLATKLSKLSLFKHNTISGHLNGKRKIIPAIANYYKLLADRIREW